jgi:hypothetical protein
VAVICKTAAEAEKLHARLKDKVNIKLVCSGGEEIEKGAVVIPHTWPRAWSLTPCWQATFPQLIFKRAGQKTALRNLHQGAAPAGAVLYGRKKPPD